MPLDEGQQKIKKILLLEPVIVGRKPRKRFEVVEVDGLSVTHDTAVYLITRNRERPAAIDWTRPSDNDQKRVAELKARLAKKAGKAAKSEKDGDVKKDGEQNAV